MDEGVEVVGDLNSIGDIINTSTPPGSLSPQSSPFLKPLRKPPVRRFALAGSSSTTSRRNQGSTLDDELFAASINSDAQDLDVDSVRENLEKRITANLPPSVDPLVSESIRNAFAVEPVSQPVVVPERKDRGRTR